jgi:hypothetical protein
MTTDRASERRRGPWHRLIVIAGWWLAIVVAIVTYIKTAYPEPSAFEYQVIRTVFAGAAAFIALVLPTFVHSWPSSSKLALMVGAGSALFAAAYVYSPAPFFLLPPDQHLTTFTVCRGENPGACGPVDVFVGCGDPNSVVTKKCADTPTPTQLFSHDGNRCGYTVWQFSCKARIR